MNTASRADVVYVFDNNYAPITGVSITSLFVNNTDLDEINVYLLGYKIDKTNRGRFEKLATRYGRKIQLVDITKSVDEYENLGLLSYGGSYVPFEKLFCVDHVPIDVDHLIYVDCDIIAMRSIRPLLQTDGLISMIKDSLALRTGNPYQNASPFNSKLIVFDAKRWRAEKWSDKFRDFLANFKEKFYPAEEPVYYLVCKDEIKTLPLQFAVDPIFRAVSKEDYLAVSPNLVYSPEEVSTAYQNPLLIHMAPFFGEKPWQDGTIHPDKELFDKYLKLSLWSDYKKQPVSTGGIYEVERWMFRHLPGKMFYRFYLAGQRYFAKKIAKKLKE